MPEREAMRVTLPDKLRAALDPKSVAIVGASDNENKIGGARGLVSGAAARLRGARPRPPQQYGAGARDPQGSP
ncbi:MAG TPA: hypothetical protein VNM24_15425 [Burkholderiales bacterium]|jgi:hypothetical protein|nr:hypothetical protein [Burkholderiales bacterium]